MKIYSSVIMTSKYLAAILICLFIILFVPKSTSAEEICHWNLVHGRNGDGTLMACDEGEKNEDQWKCDGLDYPNIPAVPIGHSYYVKCCCSDEPTESTNYVNVDPINPQLSVPIPNLELSILASSSGKFYIPWIGQYISALYNYGFSIASLVASVILMAGGLLWLTAGGNDERIDRAKDIIAGSIIGILILLSTHLILLQINPDLVTFNPIKMIFLKRKIIESIDPLLRLEHGIPVENFVNSGCATDEELEKGVMFFSTGYYKPPYEDNLDFYCAVGLNCWCPNNNARGTQLCPDGITFPCLPFSSDTPYCNKTVSGLPPKVGMVAGPECNNLPLGTKICYADHTFTITDRGGAIQGKRIDIFSRNLERTNQNTGHAILKKGPCE